MIIVEISERKVVDQLLALGWKKAERVRVDFLHTQIEWKKKHYFFSPHMYFQCLLSVMRTIRKFVKTTHIRHIECSHCAYLFWKKSFRGINGNVALNTLTNEWGFWFSIFCDLALSLYCPLSLTQAAFDLFWRNVELSLLISNLNLSEQIVPIISDSIVFLSFDKQIS